MIDESLRVSPHGGVDDGVVVNLEHVAADAATLVELFPLVGEDSADLLAGVFDHHLARLNLALAVETATVDLGPKDR